MLRNPLLGIGKPLGAMRKRQMNNLKTIVGFLLLLTLFGCKKDPPVCLGPTITVEKPIDPTIKDCYVFQEGSWWVYEELMSGMKDSVYVDSSITYWYVDKSSCLKHSPWKEYEYDIYDTMFISHHEYTKVYKTSTHYKKQREYRTHHKNPIFTSWDGPNGVTRPTEYYFLTLDLDDSTTSLAEQLDSLDIVGYSFTNLYKLSHYQSRAYMHHFDDNWPYNDTMVYYLVPNIGLVKREDFTNDEVWELKNYNIVQ